MTVECLIRQASQIPVVETPADQPASFEGAGVLVPFCFIHIVLGCGHQHPQPCTKLYFIQISALSVLFQRPVAVHALVHTFVQGV